MLFHPEVTLDFNLLTAEVTALFAAFKLVEMLVFTASHTVPVVDWTAANPDVIWLLMELTALWTVEAPLCKAAPIFAQLVFTAASTPAMDSVMAVESVVDRLFAAVSTRPTLEVIPSASPCMKSGIQLSKSVRGPSSGTEKCRKDRILSATLMTAEATFPIQDLMPFTMPLMISEPQLKACPASPLIKDTAELKPFVMVVLIFVMVVEMPLFTLFQMLVTVVLILFMTVDTALFAALNPVVSTDLMPFTTVDTVDLMAFHTVETTDFTAFITVVTTVLMALKPVVMTDLIPFTTVVIAVLMAFHIVVTTVLIALSTVVTTVLMAFQAVVTAVFIAVSTVVMTVLMEFQIVVNTVFKPLSRGVRKATMPFQIFVIVVWIVVRALLIKILIASQITQNR